MPIAAHMRSLRWLIAPAVAAVAIGGLAGCDAASPADGSPREVTVVGNGEVQGSPDTLTAEVGIEFTAADASTVMTQTSDRQRELITALTDAGVEERDIATTRVSLQPQYGNDPAGASVITGYRATNSIRVTIRELDSASEALALIVSTGGDATRIDSVSYSIDNDSDLVRDARERAFTDAKDRAEQYAELAGLKLGKVLSISETGGEDSQRPSPAPAQRAMADVPLEPGEQTVSFAVTAVWELK
ncbi:SIMPL domain-containing protein [Mycobacterium sp. 1274756.6]|uniref:SIMPL domain-containing protein n=1 Tax=Mycobacterium sp. 1274756.6 TaxID=1834076 RepID=UPI000801A409|nr:SIMPL domain-containing protein [Mycobacterium sp. 1274756.6]OBJ70621.1 hypothetical protein A5643_09540 [Mycobacterium sp. 1274756.6]